MATGKTKISRRWWFVRTYEPTPRYIVAFAKTSDEAFAQARHVLACFNSQMTCYCLERPE